MATILAVETSCDETAAAIVKNRQICSNIVASQAEVHRAYGGIVPEVAARKHLDAIAPCIERAFAQAGCDWAAIDGVAVTCAPGLTGALMVGLNAAKTLAVLHDKPFLGIHHLEGHICAHYLSEPQLQPPFICLLVSGGHTSTIRVRDCGSYELLGMTRDDAAGEAFDKVARLLGLGYPGGPAIERAARTGNPAAFDLPEGKVSARQGGYHPYDCSFSGLKTAVLRLTQQLEAQGPLPVADLAASFQATVARALTRRAIAAARDCGIGTIAVGGGVAANSGLRQQLQAAAQSQPLRVLFPPLALCTDNAAMIGCAAAERFERGWRSPLTLGVTSRLSLERAGELYAPPSRARTTELSAASF